MRVVKTAKPFVFYRVYRVSVADCVTRCKANDLCVTGTKKKNKWELIKCKLFLNVDCNRTTEPRSMFLCSRSAPGLV